MNRAAVGSVRQDTDKRPGLHNSSFMYLPRIRSAFLLPCRLAAVLLTTFTLAIIPMPINATEEPAYQVVRSLQDIEVRQYASYTVAEVIVDGPACEAGNQAFPILAGYIFGKNKGEKKFAMTAPVTQSVVPVKMEMTAPVTQSATKGGFLVQFVLPKGVTVANAPEALDARVQFREVLPSQVAVIQYSGFWSEANYSEHLAKLKVALQAANLATTGEAILSRYNSPFTPWFIRRNEIWLHLAIPL